MIIEYLSVYICKQLEITKAVTFYAVQKCWRVERIARCADSCTYN